MKVTDSVGYADEDTIQEQTTPISQAKTHWPVLKRPTPLRSYFFQAGCCPQRKRTECESENSSDSIDNVLRLSGNSAKGSRMVNYSLTSDAYAYEICVQDREENCTNPVVKNVGFEQFCQQDKPEELLQSIYHEIQYF